MTYRSRRKRNSRRTGPVYRVRRRMVRTTISGSRRLPWLKRLMPAEVTRIVDAGAGLELGTHRGRFIAAGSQESVNVWRLAAETADDVARALDERGIQYFAMHLPHTRITRWGIRRSDLPAAAGAIAAALGRRGYYYSLTRDHPARLVAAGLSAEECATLVELRVYRFVHCRTRNKMYGASEGCRISVWDESEERPTLVSADRSSLIQEIDRTNPIRLQTRARWDGAAEPILAGTGHDAAAIEYPIDAVYLWVDDSDPQWRAKRAAVRRKLGYPEAPQQQDDTIAAHRFRDRGELRASLRSLEANAPWIRRIYLVTDDQRPDWLDLDHGRIQLVDHKEIFADPDVLPTYNSHAIGSQIHRIPGLADHYLLMNDDVMFANPVTPYEFFTPAGQLRVFLSRSRRPDIDRDSQTSLERARTNSAELLERDYQRRVSRLFGHVPVPQRKDVATEVAQRYAEEIEQTLRSPFRAETDVVINSWLHLYTALFTGRGVESRIRYGYFNIGRSEVREKMERRSFIDQYQVVCLNDVPAPAGEREADPEWLPNWLAQVFPVPAPFERPAARYAPLV